jgi:hypothetical protein
MRPTLHHLLRSLILVLLEILHKQSPQLLHLAFEVCSAVPRLCRVEQFFRDVGAGLRDREVEGLVGFEFGFRELAGVDGV